MNIPSTFHVSLNIGTFLTLRQQKSNFEPRFKLQIITVTFLTVPSKNNKGFRHSPYLKDLKTRFFLFFFLALASWIQPWMIFFSLFLANTTESGSAGLEALIKKNT